MLFRFTAGVLILIACVIMLVSNRTNDSSYYATYESETLNIRTNFFIGCETTEECLKLMPIWADKDELIEKLDRIETCLKEAAACHDRGVVVSKTHNLEYIAHEALHATNYSLDQIGVPQGSDTEEVYAYVLGDMVADIYNSK